MNRITKTQVLNSVSGFVGGDKEDEVREAIRKTPWPEIRQIIVYLREDARENGSDYVSPENVVWQIASRNGIDW